MCSPRMWGWSVRRALDADGGQVLPTHVGMVRAWRPRAAASTSAPHAHGDGPGRRAIGWSRDLCSPRTWGWSALGHAALGECVVLPTHVGMVLRGTAGAHGLSGAPHARGDGPAPGGRGVPPGAVLPTHVGMVRRTVSV